MKKIIVDTNAFLRFLLNDIPVQADEVEDLFTKAKRGLNMLIVPAVVIFEIAYTLEDYYSFSKEETVHKLESLLSMPYLQVQEKSIFDNAIRIFKTNNLSLPDSFLSCFAKQERAQLFTFDKKLQKLAASSRTI